MEQFVSFFAPRRKVDYLTRWLFFVLGVNIVNYFVLKILSPERPFDLLTEPLLTTLVATPFIFLALFLLGHQAKLQERLTDLAATDMLTGLMNRRAFMTAANDEERRGTVGAILVIDADHFKKVNDTHGHAIGDQCLQEIAGRIRQLVRGNDVIGRLGGEEFAIYLTGGTAEMAQAVGQRLAEGIELATAETIRFRVTMSVGTAVVRPGDSIERMLGLADEALYRAKETGRARVCYAPT